jgi:hypothetical protein
MGSVLITPVTDSLRLVGGATIAPYVYFTDYGNNRVVATDYDGNFKFSFGTFGTGNGQFNGPWGVTNDNQYVYVTDSGNNRVQKFTMFGVFVAAYGSYGTADGEYDTPKGIAVTDYYIVIVDSGNNRITFLNKSDGNHVFTFGEYGTALGQFDNPQACFADDAYLYVEDTGNARWQIFELSIDGSGVADADLPGLTGEATGLTSCPAIAEGELPAIESSSTGGVKFAGELVAELPAITGQSDGYSMSGGDSNGVIPAIISASTGVTGHMGTSEAILPCLESSADGGRIGVGGASGILPAITGSGAGNVTRALPSFAAFTVNMRNKGITDYTNYDFNSFAVIGGKLYGATKSGIHPIEGDDDNGAEINASFKTGRIDLHSGNVRRLVDAWITGRFPGGAMLNVHEDESDEDVTEYEILGDNSGIHDERVDFARGHKERFPAIEFANVNGEDFDVTGITVNARDIARRQR